jgi:hypothetical protein
LISAHKKVTCATDAKRALGTVTAIFESGLRAAMTHDDFADASVDRTLTRIGNVTATPTTVPRQTLLYCLDCARCRRMDRLSLYGL